MYLQSIFTSKSGNSGNFTQCVCILQVKQYSCRARQNDNVSWDFLPQLHVKQPINISIQHDYSGLQNFINIGLIFSIKSSIFPSYSKQSPGQQLYVLITSAPRHINKFNFMSTLHKTVRNKKYIHRDTQRKQVLYLV